MSTTCETWENTYSGFDRAACRDHTGITLAGVRSHLPQPTISPTCVKKGHEWIELPSSFPQRYFTKSWSRLYGCGRCSKRGMVVLRTDGFTETA